MALKKFSDKLKGEIIAFLKLKYSFTTIIKMYQIAKFVLTKGVLSKLKNEKENPAKIVETNEKRGRKSI